MQSTIRTLAVASLAVGFASAQSPCFEQNFGVLAPLTGGTAGFGDDVMFDLQSLNFTLSFGAASYTHAQVSENGIVYLTTGGATNGPSGLGNAYQNIDVFLGTTVGDDPRIAPLFMDFWSQPGVSGGVWINNTIPGKFVVTWERVVEWWATTQPGPDPVYTFQAQIFDTGDVWFYFDQNVDGTINSGQNDPRCGVSRGDGVSDPGSSDLSAGASNLADFVMYEAFPFYTPPAASPFDLNEQVVQFVWAGTGYVQVTQPCTPAFHEPYGEGCYDISDSFYEFHDDAVIAAAELTGTSLRMIPSGTEYVVQFGGGTYMTPTAAAQPVFATPTDDGETTLTPTVPFPTPTGPAAVLNVHSNAVVSWGGQPQTFPGTNQYTPTPTGMLEGVNAGIYAWHDYSETGTGSGRIVQEEMVISGETVLLITWDNVNSWPLGNVNPSEMQMQLNLTTGAITLVFQTITNDASSAFGSAHLIGYSPAGVSVDQGEVDLSAVGTFATSPVNISAPTLSAGPAPISNSSSGTTITYTTDGMIEYAPGVAIGLNILSGAQVPAGTPLAFLGAPGCAAYIGSLDFTQAMVGPGPTQAVTFSLPSGLPSGLEIYSQSVILLPPNSLPNGQNAFGMTVTNGVRSVISNF